MDVRSHLESVSDEAVGSDWRLRGVREVHADEVDPTPRKHRG